MTISLHLYGQLSSCAIFAEHGILSVSNLTCGGALHGECSFPCLHRARDCSLTEELNQAFWQHVWHSAWRDDCPSCQHRPLVCAFFSFACSFPRASGASDAAANLARSCSAPGDFQPLERCLTLSHTLFCADHGLSLPVSLAYGVFLPLCPSGAHCGSCALIH